MKIYINGKFYSRKDAKVSVYDHGLLYGDGVFEGIRIYNGRIFKLDEHLERLARSAQFISLKLPMSLKRIEEATIETVRVNRLHDGYIRLVVTRGEGNLGLDPRKCKVPQIIIIADQIELYPRELYEKGMAIITVPARRNMPESVDPRVKSLNYLNNILAKIEGANAGYNEVLMINSLGFVAECSADNVFAIADYVLMTPPASMGALEGITRNTVMEIAPTIGLEAKERIMTRYDFICADECFLTGSGAEIVPVIAIDGRAIGNGKPGRITKKLIKAFHKLTQTTGTPVYKR